MTGKGSCWGTVIMWEDDDGEGYRWERGDEGKGYDLGRVVMG